MKTSSTHSVCVKIKEDVLIEDLEMNGWERQISQIEQQEDLQDFINSYRKEYCYE